MIIIFFVEDMNESTMPLVFYPNMDLLVIMINDKDILKKK